MRLSMLAYPGTLLGTPEHFAVILHGDTPLTARLRHIRATDPKQFALFTGRDQMQALTGLWAQQFGTPNWARSEAHV